MPDIIYGKGIIQTHPPSSSGESDDDDDDLPYHRFPPTREAEINKNLEFNNRYDPAIFKETPFTRAATNASRRTDQSSQEEARARPPEESGWTVVKGGNVTKKGTAGKVWRAPIKPGGSIPVANPDPGGRNDMSKQPNKGVAGALKQDKTTVKKSAWGGWTSKGVPVATTAPVKKKSLIESTDELLGKNKGKKKAAAKPKTGGAKAAKGKKTQKGDEEEDGKITFSRIPAGAGPSSDFPIVQGLEKQRNLPATTRHATVSKTRLGSDDSSDSEKLPSLDILFKGVGADAEKELKELQRQKQLDRKTQTTSAASEDIKPFPKRQSKIEPEQTNREGGSEVFVLSSDDDVRSDFSEDEDEPQDPTQREQRRNMHALRDDLLAQNAHVRQRRSKANSTFSSPSTITRVDMPVNQTHIDTSSSDLPYSSPLERYNDTFDIYNPHPARTDQYVQNHVGMLERMVDDHTGWHPKPVRSTQRNPNYHSGTHNDYHQESKYFRDDDRGRYKANDYQPQELYDEVPRRKRRYSDEEDPSVPHLNADRAYASRELSPDSPRLIKRSRIQQTPPRLAQIHRRLATVKQFRPESPEDPHSSRDSWSTLPPPKSRFKSQEPSEVRQSGPFRLPLRTFQANPGSSSSSTRAGSTQSSKANWFRPTPLIDNRKQDDGYSIVTSRGVIAPKSSTSKISERPVFITEASSTSEQDRFHDRLKASVGLKGYAKDLDPYQPRQFPMGSSQTRYEPEPEEDWRNAWSRSSQTQSSRSSGLAKFAYDRPSRQME